MSDSSSDSTKTRGRRTRLLVGVALVSIVLGAGYGAFWYYVGQYSVSTDDAYVHGNEVRLMSQVSGTVVDVDADNTDFVRQGQPLVELDRSDAEVALQKAEANLAQTVRSVRQLYAQEAEQKAVIAQRQATVTQARRDYERAKRLLARHVVSEEKYQQDQTAWQRAKANLQAARQKLVALRSQVEGTDAEHHPRVRLAVSQVRKAWLNLRRTTVVAPVSGFVARRSVQVGQEVTPGDALLAIVPLAQVWVQANFKETDLSKVRIGQPVTVHADFYGSKVTYHGKVAGLSAGTGSAFELLPPQNATGNWIKVVQRVPVRITLDPDDVKTHPLRLGLSLSVAIDVHDTTGPVLAAKPTRGPVYSTPVFHRREKGLDRLIARIIRANSGTDGNLAHAAGK